MHSTICQRDELAVPWGINTVNISGVNDLRIRVVVNLDGTICDVKQPGQSYLDVLPKEGSRETLINLRGTGAYIIIYTARHMRTCNNNVELVRETMEETTRQWLSKHCIPFDELVFGKPYGDIYIDDLAIPFVSWTDVKAYLDCRISECKLNVSYDEDEEHMSLSHHSV